MRMGGRNYVKCVWAFATQLFVIRDVDVVNACGWGRE